MPRETAVRINRRRLGFTLTTGGLWRSLPQMVTTLALAIGLWLTAAAASDDTIVSLTDPVAWAQIDTAALKGRPARLAWSDDRSELYLQVVQGSTTEDLTFRHYIIRKDSRPRPIDKMPKWVEEYWKWKSAKVFFGDPLFTIEVETTRQILDNLNGTSTNKTPYLSDTPLTGNQLTLARQPGETQITNRLMLNGVSIGEFVDELIVPGYTFSWSPEELRLIAFRANAGRLSIMNEKGRIQTIRRTNNVILPAWSDDGAAIAYLERTDRRTFTLYVVEILQQ
jgi:hypothetical protein